MKINEILVESQQLDEGPFTQAVGKVGGKIARGVANVGKDLATGFKAGYSGEEPPAATTPTPTTSKAKSAATGSSGGIKGAVDAFKKGFSGSQTDTTTTAADNAEAEKQSKIGVGQINKIIPTLRMRDLMSLQANLEKAIAAKQQRQKTQADTAQTDAGAGAFGQMANQLTKAAA